MFRGSGAVAPPYDYGDHRAGDKSFEGEKNEGEIRGLEKSK
jgi:hypothetical protein